MNSPLEILSEFVNFLTHEKRVDDDAKPEMEDLDKDSNEDFEPQLLLKSLSVLMERVDENADDMVSNIVDEIVEPIPERVASIYTPEIQIINSVLNLVIEKAQCLDPNASSVFERAGSQVKINIPGVWTPYHARTNAALIYLYFRIVS